MPDKCRKKSDRTHIIIKFAGLLYPANQAVMSKKQTISIGLILAVFLLVFGNSSCGSRMAVCDANQHGKSAKMKKNRSNYGVRYDYKSKPVGKNYLIRNGR
jgi:hypothetical protein